MLPLVPGFAARLVALRTAKYWTGAALARRVGVTQATVWAYEQGKYRPRPETLRRLADALGADYAELAQLVGIGTEAEEAATRRAARARASVGGVSGQLLAARTRKGWTQAECGRRAGLTRQAIWRYEQGRHPPREERLRQLADALGANYAELARLAGYSLESKP